MNSCSSLPELELKTRVVGTAATFPFSVQFLAKGPPFTSDSPPRRQAQKELTSLSPSFEVSCFDTANTLHTAMQSKKLMGESLSGCDTWSQSPCMNKNYTHLSPKLKTIRITSLQPELNKHTAKLSGEWGSAHRVVSEVQAPSAATSLSSSVCTAAVEGCTDQPMLTMLWDEPLKGRQAVSVPRSTWAWFSVTAIPYYNIIES